MNTIASQSGPDTVEAEPSTKKFINTAKAIPPEEFAKRKYPSAGDYGFDKVPILLFLWSGLFQRLVSQAGTFLLTGKFHGGECGIYKCEGGCRIAGVNDLVLYDHCCRWDYDHRGNQDAELKKMADLISAMVLGWDPENPLNTLVWEASKFSGAASPDLTTAISTRGGNPFGGDALSSFFDWNPFSEAPIDREYQRYCLVTFNGETETAVSQKFSDEDLGEDLMKRVNDKLRAQAGGRYCNDLMCCRPRREGSSVIFWCNTGRSTQLDGWKTAEELKAFIASDEAIKDTATY